jgi:hypothetical protein
MRHRGQSRTLGQQGQSSDRPNLDLLSESVSNVFEFVACSADHPKKNADERENSHYNYHTQTTQTQTTATTGHYHFFI